MRKFLAIIVLIIQLLALFLLLMAFLAPFIPPDRLVFPAFAGLVFPWIYFINAFFVIVLLILKPKFAILGILFLALQFYDIAQHVRLAGKHEETAEGVKILSYNCQGLRGNNQTVKGKALSDTIASFISRESPDIICLQEFRGVKEDETEQFITRFRESVGAANFHYQRYFSDHSQNAALCLLTLSKYPIVARNAIQLGKRRIGMYTDIVIQNDTIRIFNLHLQSTRIVKSDIDFVMGTLELQNRGEYKKLYDKLAESYRLRSQQARLVALEIKNTPYPVVVCGDFNDTPTSFAYHRIKEDLKDAFIVSGKGMGNTYNSDLTPPIRIDYVLFSQSFKSSQFEIYHIPYSDHFPVSATISIP
ncbi:MAG: endonuclease/exonuclease/phosphatase family protein [Bacteroidales bacterium]|jgi:endonuclease/exonuclease/phosphatase family metal-dependent hydrolase|nr:endonuclease/exonuclease/phosphatase family protein [Bacteroidales bacterium]